MDILSTITQDLICKAEHEAIKDMDLSIIKKIDRYQVSNEDALEFAEALALFLQKNREAFDKEGVFESTETNLMMLNRAFKLGYMRAKGDFNA